MPKKIPLPIIIGTNEQRVCAVEWCGTHRYRVSPYCRRHTNARHSYGHPLGRYVSVERSPKAPTIVEHETIATFISKHQGHPALEAGCQVVQEWLQAACLTPTQAGASAIRHLHDHGVKPLSVIEVVLTLCLYSERNPKTLPDDLRLTYAVGRGVLRLAPSPRRIAKASGNIYRGSKLSSTNIRVVGGQLRERLAPLAANVMKALRDSEKFARDKEVSMSTGFNPVVVTMKGSRSNE